MTKNRGDFLREVADLITKDRQSTHGEAVDQLTHAAMLKSAIGHHNSPHLTGAEVEAIDMIAVKLSRLAKGKPILDHYLDIAGYAAIAAEARANYGLIKPAEQKTVTFQQILKKPGAVTFIENL